MPIQNIAKFANAIIEDGAFYDAFFHKSSVPPPSTAAWVDLSMGAGIPKYNAYVGGQATATPLVGSGNDGIFLGANPAAGKDRYINSITLQGTSVSLAPAFIMLMDYLLHYPLIDGDNTDIQDMENPFPLPRYTSGDGVHCMAVCTTPMTADAVMTVTYTNSLGVSGRTSVSRLVSSAIVGTIISASDQSSLNTRRSPFIPLDNGDTGIRSIESVVLSDGSGGFFALVLVKPITQVQMLETGVASEVFSIPQKAGVAPKILNGAYLNMIMLCNNSSLISPFRGHIQMGVQ